MHYISHTSQVGCQLTTEITRKPSQRKGKRATEIDERYRRLTQNHVSFPVGLPGCAAIQFGGFQGHFSDPH